MNDILKLIVCVAIVFFVWNILKKMFLKKLYRNFPFANQNQQDSQERKASQRKEPKVKWDAETVEYEEIEENDKKEK